MADVPLEEAVEMWLGTDKPMINAPGPAFAPSCGLSTVPPSETAGVIGTPASLLPPSRLADLECPSHPTKSTGSRGGRPEVADTFRCSALPLAEDETQSASR